MKLSAAEDKLKREKTLAETRAHVADFSLESVCKSQMAEQQLAFEKQLDAFFTAVLWWSSRI
jgi:hypothetical protein